MTKNKIFYTSLILAILFGRFMSQPIHAQEKVTTIQPMTTTLQQKNIDLKKTNANKEIDRRITSLNTLIEKLVNVKRLSPDQKNSFLSQIQTEINDLQSLKSKITADTELTMLKTDKQSIIDSYRIYAIFLPKISILSHADSILNITEMLKTKSPGDAAMAKITDAETLTQKAINEVITLTPEGYPGNKSVLTDARAQLENARKDINQAVVLIRANSKSAK